MNYFYYFLQASLVVLIIYTIPKLWALTFEWPAIPTIPKLPEGILRSFTPYQEMLIFLLVAFFTIVIVEKWLKHLFVQRTPMSDEDKPNIKLTTNMGTFGNLLMKK